MKPLKNITLTLEELKEVLHYDPESGHFTWLKDFKGRGYRNMLKGQLAGHKIHSGHADNPDNRYIQIHINKKAYLAHRLAWFYMKGEWPKDQIDHDNRIKSDNRWANLKESNNFLQQGNIGGSPNRNICKVGKKYRVRFRFSYDLGSFDSLEEAVRARDEKAKVVYGEFWQPMKAKLDQGLNPNTPATFSSEVPNL